MHPLFNNIFGLSALLCGALASAQVTPYEFQKLKAIDTISDAEYQKTLGSPDVQSNAFMVSKWLDKNGTQRLALFKKTGDNWVVFALYEEQYTEAVKLSEDEKYLTYRTSTKASSRGHFESYAYFCIVDLNNEKQMPILQESNEENWELAEDGEQEKDMEKTGCSAQIVFLGKGNLTSIYTASKDFDPKNFTDNCLPKGQYTIKNDKLVKIK